jgi:Protein of unknown function (DUF3108)/Plectin repeat
MSRRLLRRTMLGLAMGATAAGHTVGSVALAQGKLDARYIVTLGGMPFGRGAWVVDVKHDHFTSAVSGATSGLVQLFSKGRGASSVQGTVAGGQLSATAYMSSIQTDRKYDEVRMVLNAGTVKEFAAEPPNPPHPHRIPINEAHRRGVLDPMTASIVRVPGNGNTFVPQACDRKIAVFDGRMRYDLRLAYKRLDKVSSERGYQGNVVVCGVYFSPVAGHIPERAVLKYVEKLRDTEMWLAPIAGTRLMVPYRVSVTTPLGQGVLQATQFLSSAQLERATRTSTKPQ